MIHVFLDLFVPHATAQINQDAFNLCAHVYRQNQYVNLCRKSDHADCSWALYGGRSRFTPT